MQKNIFFILLIFNVANIYSQSKSDSLLKVINSTKTDDTNHILALNEWAFINKSKKADSSLLFAQKAKEYSEKINYITGLSKSCKNIGIYYQIKGDYSEALKYYFQAIEYAEKINAKKDIGNAYNNIGNIYRNQGIYETAFDFFLKSLKIDEELGDKKGISTSYNNIGVIFDDQGNNEKALEYYTKSLEIREQLNDKSLLGLSYNNIGHIYANMKENEKALIYYFKAYKIHSEAKEKRSLSLTCGNIGSAYLNINKPDSAYPYIIQGVEIADLIKSGEQRVYMKNILARYYIEKKQYELAYKIASESQKISEEIGNVELIRSASVPKFQSLEYLKKFEEAYEVYKYYNLLDDSIRNEKNQKKSLSQEWIFKEEKLKAENEAKEKQRKLEKQREDTINIALAIVLVLLVCVVVVILIAYRMKNKAFELIRKQKNEILDKNEELKQLNEEIAAQRDEIEEQHEIVLRQKQNITDSIKYASRIQKAVLPSNETISSIFQEHFILFKPRDIVSGDFYFVKQLNNFSLIAAADCTGHGVPGAIMSMLGVTILNELITKTEINSSAKLLNELRFQLKASLQQTGEKGQQQDGMDIAFCAINNSTNQLNFSGAYNPCWIYRKSENGETNFTVLEADHQPVGIYTKELSFTDQYFQLQKNDVIYLFTDGYHSQFGGEKFEKYKIGKMKTLFTTIFSKEINEQKIILDNEFEQWKGHKEQTDDVLVVGIKI